VGEEVFGLVAQQFGGFAHGGGLIV